MVKRGGQRRNQGPVWDGFRQEVEVIAPLPEASVFTEDFDEAECPPWLVWLPAANPKSCVARSDRSEPRGSGLVRPCSWREACRRGDGLLDRRLPASQPCCDDAARRRPPCDGTNRFRKHSATLVNAIEAHGPADEVKAETILYDALPLYLRELYCHGCIIGRAYPRTINPSELNQRLEFRQA